MNIESFKISGKFIFIIILIFVFFTSCSSENNNIFFTPGNNIDKEEFIRNSMGGRTTVINIDDSKIIPLPNTDKYDSTIKDIYYVNNYFMCNDTIYLKRIKTYTTINSVSILKIKKDTLFEIKDCINFESNLYNKRLIDAHLSPNKNKIIVLYQISKNKSILEIQSADAETTYFSILIPKLLILNQQCWSENQNEAVFRDYNGGIYIIDITTGKIRKLEATGINVIWMKGLNTICFQQSNNSFKIYSLEKEQIIQEIKLNNELLSKSYIINYYWFNKQKKLLLNIRYINRILDFLWRDTELIFDYKSDKFD